MRLSPKGSAVVLLLLGASCGLSREEYREVVEEARACSPVEGCVLAGGGQCTCPTPVAAGRAAEVDEAAAEVRCGGAMAECAAFLSIACVDGLCTGQ